MIRVIVHPSFSESGSYADDVALLRLEEPGAVIGRSVRPVCLPVSFGKVKVGIPDELIQKFPL